MTVIKQRMMTAADLPALHTLSAALGWPHRQEDWSYLLSLGYGLVVEDKAGRVIASGMGWPHGTIGMIIVSPACQGQGIGRSLLRALIARSNRDGLTLVATAAGLPLYEKEGFVATGPIYQHQGIVIAPAARAEARIRSAGVADLPAIAVLDNAVTGMDRLALLRSRAIASSLLISVNEGQLRGFAACRRFGRGHVIGPLVATDVGTAVALLQQHLSAHSGAFLRVDTPCEGGAFVEALAEAGLARIGGGMTMWRGARRGSSASGTIFSLTSQALA